MGLDPSVPQPRRGSIHDTGDEGVDPSGAPPWGAIRDIEPPKGLDPSVPQPRSGSIRDTGDEGVDPSGAPPRGSIRDIEPPKGARSERPATPKGLDPRHRRRGGRSVRGAAVGVDPRYRAPKWGSIRASRNREGARSTDTGDEGVDRSGAPPRGSIRDIEPQKGLDPSVPQPRRGWCQGAAKSGQKWDPKSGHSSGSGSGVAGRAETGPGRLDGLRVPRPRRLREGRGRGGAWDGARAATRSCESGSWRLATAAGPTPPPPADRTPGGPPWPPAPSAEASPPFPRPSGRLPADPGGRPPRRRNRRPKTVRGESPESPRRREAPTGEGCGEGVSPSPR